MKFNLNQWRLYSKNSWVKELNPDWINTIKEIFIICEILYFYILYNS